MRSGTLPSPGRRIVLNGRVGASRRSICMPVMTFLYFPKPYSGFRSAAKSLKPVATTTAPTSTSSSLVAACAGRCSRRPGTPSRTPRTRSRRRSRCTARRPRGPRPPSSAARSRRSRVGAAMSVAPRRPGRPGGVRLLAGEHLCLVDDRQPVVEAVRAPPVQPAVDHVRGAAALADGAGDVGGAVDHVAGGEDVRGPRSAACPGRRPSVPRRCRRELPGERARVRRHADRDDDQVAGDRRTRCRGSARAVGGRRRRARRARIFVQRRPLTAPSAVAERPRPGRPRNANSTPSRSASSTLDCVGRHLVAAAPVGDRDARGAEAPRGPRGVHGHVAATDDHDALAGEVDAAGRA